MENEKRIVREAAEGIARAMSTDNDLWRSWANDGYYGAILSNNDNHHIGLRLDWHKKDRLEIGGAYNWTEQNLATYLPYREKRAKDQITVALNRAPEAIAKEIRRRLMPGYLENLEHALNAKKASEEWKANTREKLAKVKTAVEKIRPNDKVWYSEDNDKVARSVSCYKLFDLKVENRSNAEVEITFRVSADRAVHFIEHYLALI